MAEKAEQVFHEEHQVLEEFRNALKSDLTIVSLKHQIDKFTGAYESLLRQSEKLMKLGDSAQRRLMKTQEDLKSSKSELEDSYKSLNGISQIGQAITSSMDVKNIVETVFNYLYYSNSKPDFIAIGIYDENGWIKYKYSYKNGQFIPALTIDALNEENFSKLCVDKRWSVITGKNNLEHSVQLENWKMIWGEVYESMLFMPLQIEKRIIGILTVQSSTEKIFTDNYLSILSTLTSYLGIALDNADAYKSLARRNKQLKDTLHKINQLNANLEMEREKSDRLLLNILPSSIAERLKAGESVIADYFESSTILFADIAGFTKLSAQMESPAKLVEILNSIFTAYDSIASSYQLEKIKTIGDCYMLAGGIPTPTDDHPEKIVRAGLDMIKIFGEITEKWGIPVTIRVGIHTGSVVAGVIGKTKFVYDLWGDAVNTASRMESHGMPGKVHCSESVQSRLQNKFNFDDRGIIEVKGKGPMHTFFVIGEKA